MEDLLFSLYTQHTHTPPSPIPAVAPERTERANEACAPRSPAACRHRPRQEQTNREIYFIQSRSIMLAIVGASTFTHCVPLLSCARAYIYRYIRRARRFWPMFPLLPPSPLSNFCASLSLTPPNVICLCLLCVSCVRGFGI